MNVKVIVLNGDYSYLNVVDPKRAFLYLELGKVVVEKFSGVFYKTIDGLKEIPLIVRFVKFIRQIYKRKVEWNKRNVLVRDENRCIYCGITGEELGKRMTVDHVLPVSKGGKSTWENTVCSCPDCNNKKADNLPSECDMFFRYGNKPVQPTVMEFIHKRNKDMNILGIIAQYWEECRQQ